MQKAISYQFTPILRQLKVDHALAVSPILDTVNGMSGFFLVLSFAGMVLPYLAT